MNREQKGRIEKWCRLAERLAHVTGEQHEEVRRQIYAATTCEIDNLDTELGNRLITQAGREGLLTVVEAYEEFGPRDTTPQFSDDESIQRFLSRQGRNPEPPLRSWFDKVDAARKLMNAGDHIAAFHGLCDASIVWADGVQHEHLKRKSFMAEEGKSVRLVRAEQLRRFSNLQGSKKAVTSLRELGWCSADEEREFHASVDRFQAIVDQRFPSLEMGGTGEKPHLAMLGRLLMYLITHVGIGHEPGAAYASAMAARCGFALKVNTLKGYPVKLKHERAKVSGSLRGS